MTQVHTHYDNLKVTRNAPPEIIRAAYKTLTQKFHPDRNPGNAEAERVMKLINTSYDVLSNPKKRLAHDFWIAQQEKSSAQATKPLVPPRPARQPTTAPKPSPKLGSGEIVSHLLKNWFIYGVAVLVAWVLAAGGPSTPPPGPKPYQASPTLTRPAYERPSAAPNGQPWPGSASYLKGYQQLHRDGLSAVVVDNSRNDSDVFVKLVSLSSAQAYPVRQFYIPAFGSFTLDKVAAGSYDIRYRDLSTGALSRSEAFNLERVSTVKGTQFTNITMTLFKVQNGNMQTYGLSEAEF